MCCYLLLCLFSFSLISRVLLVCKTLPMLSPHPSLYILIEFRQGLILPHVRLPSGFRAHLCSRIFRTHCKPSPASPFHYYGVTRPGPTIRSESSDRWNSDIRSVRR